MCGGVRSGRQGGGAVCFKEGEQIGQDLRGVVEVTKRVDDWYRRVFCQCLPVSFDVVNGIGWWTCSNFIV